MKEIYKGLALPQNKEDPSYGPGRISGFIRANEAEIVLNNGGDLMRDSKTIFCLEGVVIRHDYQASMTPTAKIRLYGDESKFDAIEKQLLDYCAIPQEELLRQNGQI